MNPTIPTTRALRWIRIGLGCCFLLVISLTGSHSQYDFHKGGKDEKKGISHSAAAVAKLPVEPGAVEVAFTDGSNLKLLLREEKIALATPHGKLNIAVADIQRIEFATRLSEEDDKRIRTAISDLGSTEFSKREAASARLLKLREKAYPALLRAARNKDLEVAHRARELIQQIVNSVPAQLLANRPKDVVYTADSMIAGRIEAASLKAHTSQFGAVLLKLADARSLRSQALESGSNPMPGMPMGGMGRSGSVPGLPPGSFPNMKRMGRKMPMPGK